MDLSQTPEDLVFRNEVRAWLKDNVPKDPLPRVSPTQREYMVAWQRKLYDAGWAGISWPEQYGGRGLGIIQQLIWYEEYAKAGGPEPGCLFIGLNHGGPTLIVRGTEEQKAFHLPRILKGESVWCQGFSEPNAGSDLAGIRTRGVVEGDHLVVNGQKIWTSYAQLADYQELLVRTDPNSARNRGLTWIICDMKLPGVTIRPIESITGEPRFCEVFYDDVRIPLANVVGQVDDGWRTAMSTLSFERGSAMMEKQIELSSIIEELIAVAHDFKGMDGQPVISDHAIASRLAVLRGEVQGLRAMTYMGVSRQSRQEMPGPEGTYLVLYFGELKQRIMRAAMDVLGIAGLEYGGKWEDWVFSYLEPFSRTLGGGTSEIKRNIIGERVLKLPRDARGK